MRLENAIHASTYIRGYPMPTLYIADAERDADMKNLSRKEAAKVLEDMKVKIEIPKAAVTQWKRNTALDMAIEALKYSEVPNSSDCISRQAAIDAYGDWYVEEGTAKGFIGTVKQLLEGLPSAQPERKTGEWITHYYKLGTERYECNVCHNRIGDTSYYCPNCGADMRGEQG